MAGHFKSHFKPPVPGQMNKTEEKYAGELRIRKGVGEIEDYYYEAIKLSLGHKTWYTPDFIVVFPYHIEVHEVKGFMRDDANVKIKAAARKYWWMEFFIIKKAKTGWQVSKVSP